MNEYFEIKNVHFHWGQKRGSSKKKQIKET